MEGEKELPRGRAVPSALSELATESVGRLNHFRMAIGVEIAGQGYVSKDRVTQGTAALGQTRLLLASQLIRL